MNQSIHCVRCLVGLAFALAVSGWTGASAVKEPEADKQKARVDRFGDALPPGAIARLGSVRLRNGYRLFSVAASADGKIVTCGTQELFSQEPAIRVWDVATTKEVKSIELGRKGAMVTASAFSPDGSTLAVGNSGHQVTSVSLFELRTGKLLKNCRGHVQAVTAVAFSPDGKSLASASYDKSVRVWDASSGKETLRCSGHAAPVHAVAFSPDGKTLASGSEDKTIRLWDGATGKVQRQWTAHDKTVAGLAFSGDGKTLASASGDMTVRFWDPATATEVRKMLKHQDRVESLALSADGKTLASASRDGGVILSDINTGKEVRRLQGNDISSVSFAAADKIVVARGLQSAVWIWETATGKELHANLGMKGWVSAVAYAPDGATLATASTDGIRAWDAWTGKERAILARAQGWIRHLHFSADGKSIAAGAISERSYWIRRIEDGRVVRAFDVKEKMKALAHSRDGKTFAFAGPDKSISICDAASGKEIRRFATGHKDNVFSLAYSPDSNFVASCGDSRDGVIMLWDVRGGKQVHRLEGHRHAVMAIAFTPDGRSLVSASVDHFIRHWDTSTGKQLWHWEEFGGGIASLAISPDGRFLLAGSQSNQVYLLEMATGRQIKQFLGHRGPVYAMTFAPHGRTAVSGSFDGTALEWDMTGRLLDRRIPPARLGHNELEGAWNLLGDPNPTPAHEPLWTLVAAGEQTVAFASKQLRPVPRLDKDRVRQLLAKLHGDQFLVRDKATDELEAFCDAAAPYLREALSKEAKLEVRRRLDRLLARIEPHSSHSLRRARAIAVLEHIGSSEAHKVLQGLADGAPEARLTRDARAALRRGK
ncbi:MAG: hypothetical protein FJ271_11420 [Planctomycetes bacterium]|nr:hypothetical protein [Planctomycetota bacterium]